jgi:Sec-independent protein secretion pathway component TatC
MMSLLTGLTFQFPLALIILMWIEIVRPRTLLKHWRGMLFGILCVVALITPIGDPISLGILTSVLFGFYLGAVSIGSVIVRRKRVARGDTPYPEEDEDYDLDSDESPTSKPSPSSEKPEVKPPQEGDIRSLD